MKFVLKVSNVAYWSLQKTYIHIWTPWEQLTRLYPATSYGFAFICDELTSSYTKPKKKYIFLPEFISSEIFCSLNILSVTFLPIYQKSCISDFSLTSWVP